MSTPRDDGMPDDVRFTLSGQAVVRTPGGQTSSEDQILGMEAFLMGESDSEDSSDDEEEAPTQQFVRLMDDEEDEDDDDENQVVRQEARARHVAAAAPTSRRPPSGRAGSRARGRPRPPPLAIPGTITTLQGDVHVRAAVPTPPRPQEPEPNLPPPSSDEAPLLPPELPPEDDDEPSAVLASPRNLNVDIVRSPRRPRPRPRRDPMMLEPPQLSSSTANRETRPRIKNVVCNVHVGTSLNVHEIAMRIRHAEYNPKRFPATIFRLQRPKTTHLFFPSGRVCCVGARTEATGHKALKIVVRLLQKLGYSGVRFGTFNVQTIMASCHLGFPIRLEGLAVAHSAHCRYEPEVYPGLVYFMIEPAVTLLIFVSGKVIFTGARSSVELLRAYELIYDVLYAFRGGADADEAAEHPQDPRASVMLQQRARDRRSRRRAPRDEELISSAGVERVDGLVSWGLEPPRVVAPEGGTDEGGIGSTEDGEQQQQEDGGGGGDGGEGEDQQVDVPDDTFPEEDDGNPLLGMGMDDGNPVVGIGEGEGEGEAEEEEYGEEDYDDYDDQELSLEDQLLLGD